MPSFAEIADQITADELRARGSVKWSRGGPDAIGAFIAEMDFGAAPPIEAALIDVVRRADFGYLSDRATAEMAAACAGWQADHYHWSVDPARIRPLPDVITGLQAAITVFSRPGSPVILPTPAYMPFLTVPRSLGREIIQVPMTAAAEDGRATLDLGRHRRGVQARRPSARPLQPLQPGRPRLHRGPSWRPWPRSSTPTAGWSSPTRSTPR